MNMCYSKLKPSFIHYRKFKDFNNDEKAIPFQALRESMNVTLKEDAPTKKLCATVN